MDNSHKQTHVKPAVYQSVQDAAQYTTLSERKLRYDIADRKLRAIRIGRRIVLRTVDLDRYMEAGL